MQREIANRNYIENTWFPFFSDKMSKAVIYDDSAYMCTPETVKKMLAEYGVAVIPSLLDQNETCAMRDGAWETLERLTGQANVPMLRAKPETWRTFYQLFPLHSMLLQHFGIGHAQHLWNVRQNPKVVDVFAKLWGVDPEELLVSFDGMSFHLPPEITGRGWYRENDWLHTDQSYTRNTFECAQAWVTSENVDIGDATLVVLEKSHTWHEEFAKTFGKKGKSDWCKLSPEEVQWYKTKGCQKIAIACPAGSMVLWDSRTVHAGMEPIPGRPSEPECKIRNVGYVCMTPRTCAMPKDIQKKRMAFENMRTTSHWPHKIKMFAKSPQTYGNKLPPGVHEAIVAPVLTPLGRKLAGY